MLNVIGISVGGRDSSVSAETRHGLDGTGIESRCGSDFPYTSKMGSEAYPPPLYSAY